MLATGQMGGLSRDTVTVSLIGCSVDVALFWMSYASLSCKLLFEATSMCGGLLGQTGISCHQLRYPYGPRTVMAVGQPLAPASHISSTKSALTEP